MITQKIKVVTATPTTILFKLGALFPNMSLNSLAANPGWLTETLLGGYISSITVNAPLGEYYIYYTEGTTSPPSEDALLIIESVESLTEDVTTCCDVRSYIIDSVINSGGNAQINLLYDFDLTPKLNEYVYIPSSNYAGYWRVKNATPPNLIVIDTPHIGAITGTNNTVQTFNFDNSKCLVWINREGGRSNYIFDQRRNYDGVIGDVKQFDNGESIKYIDRGKNFDIITVYKSGISDEEVDLIESLRYSVQAWEFDINTNTSTPIVLDSNNYVKYTTKTNYNEVVLKYRIAKYKTIQTQ